MNTQFHDNQQYMFACMVDKPVPSEFVDWPLHITVVPWFVPNERLEDVVSIAEAKLKNIRPFDVSVGGIRLFGHRKVNVVERGDAIRELHDRLLEGVNESAHIVAPFSFVGKNYHSHITHISGKHKNRGDGVVIDKVHLIATIQTHNSRNRQKSIRAVLRLGAP